MYQEAKGLVNPIETKKAVHQSLDDLTQAIARLQDTVTHLNNRLACVLETAPPVAETNKVPSEGSGIAHRIQTRYNAVTAITQILENIINRLEI
ncbi:MAG: hypothetical protein ACYC1K_03380 [Minisyncoccota bacterium]